MKAMWQRPAFLAAAALLSELEALAQARERFERKYLIQVLTSMKGNVSRAAEVSGKDRAEFYRLLRKHALVPSTFKSEKAVEER